MYLTFLLVAEMFGVIRLGDKRMQYVLILMAVLTASPSLAQDAKTPVQQFEDIKALTGRWSVLESERLQISFEPTANNTVVIERWETASGLHSMTVYHMDGPDLIATHYCPQGNQPRLVANEIKGSGRISFVFRDATDLDSTEEFQHELQFEMRKDGKVLRSENYWTAKGVGPKSAYTLSRLR